MDNQELKFEVNAKQECSRIRISHVVNTGIDGTARAVGSTVNHRAFGSILRITGNGKRILCREGKTQVSTSNPFLRKRIAYLQQLATQVGTIFHIETGTRL